MHKNSCYNRYMDEITLEMLLAARDRRAEKQRALLNEFPDTALVCLTVNVPGPVKRTPAAERVFAAGCRALSEALCGYAVPHRELIDAAAGREAYWLVRAGAEEVKRLCCGLEAALPYGRLLDMDVLAKGGAPLSRTALGLPARGCLVCGRAGASCYSRRLHPLSEVQAAFETLAARAPEAIGQP